MTILDKFNLSGKTALVTGARRGIGKAMAVALAEAGADIVATSAGMEEKGSTVEREVAARGRRCGFRWNSPLSCSVPRVPQSIFEFSLREEEWNHGGTES